MFEKSEMKKSIYHSAGCDADDWLEGARRNTNAFEGAKRALKKSSQELLAIGGVVKKDLDGGKLDGLEPSEIAAYAILQVTRCRDSLENASLHYGNRQIAASGEIAAYEKLVGHFGKLHEREESKIQGLKDAIASGEIVIEDDGEMSKGAGNGQITGVRPGSGLAAQRKAEAAAEKSSEDDGTPVDAALEKPKKKRKKRKTKSAETEVAKPSDGENT